LPRFDDPPLMPRTGESPEELLARSASLAGTPGQDYVEKRGVPLDVAEAAGVRFDADFNGRPAVIVPLHDRNGVLTSIHGRYLQTLRKQNKMLTVGPGGGVINVQGGWSAEPLILVEGLFDALSLATAGIASTATIGRWAPWLPEVCAGRDVWLGFDASRPGDVDAETYAQRLSSSDVYRLPPPPRCLDWSTALVKIGHRQAAHWVREQLEQG